MISRRSFLHTTMMTGASSLLPHAFWSCRENVPLVIGENDFQYRIVPHWGRLDATRFPVKDCHEMVQTKNGDLYLLTNHTRNNILVYNLDGRLTNAWGTQFPGAHGLTLFDENGTEVLWITDYERHQVFKTTLNGQILLTLDAPQDIEIYRDKTNYKPTETAVAPDGSLFVADGYGAQNILHYDPQGHLIKVFGGYGTEKDQFINAHGICLDDRNNELPTLLITAREQQAVKRFSLEGDYLQTISFPGAHICRPVIHKKNCYYSVLKSNTGVGNSDSGFVLITDENDSVVSCPGAIRIEKEGTSYFQQKLRIFQYPHDVCIDQDENIYVAQWNSGNSYPIKLERV